MPLTKSKFLNWRLGFGFVAFILLLYFFWWQNQKALEYHWTDYDGNIIQSQDLSDKLVLINYWATWCSPCLREIPALAEFQKEHNSIAQVIGINYDRYDTEGLKKIADFIADNPINYPIVLQQGNNLKQFGSIQGLPTTLILHHNRLVKTYTGELHQKHFDEIVSQYNER